jgi:hypothetical protein
VHSSQNENLQEMPPKSTDTQKWLKLVEVSAPRKAAAPIEATSSTSTQFWRCVSGRRFSRAGAGRGFGAPPPGSLAATDGGGPAGRPGGRPGGPSWRGTSSTATALSASSPADWDVASASGQTAGTWGDGPGAWNDGPDDRC